ncbi:restriction endonuclease subunit S [Colwellia sp. 4_MG-2023]|uniref:restriction endonuclease subunit S n=1 Tax=unclassified Colwellia TaxID=196834 RepID=UPI0026E207F1|nr:MULTISPECIES: restriction endonuclease subunit S [unclassified Colwellia]MDO6505549.1 restriction endonuclease subunit S [Colwellia sp. 5_MG-2023]MDO6554155.1 restriction endonuclease subunit S [Colwellia sp. 4_MG-2023]
MSELPKGWALSNLSGITSLDGVVSDGDWVESKDQDPNGDVRLIQLADIGDGKFINKSNRFMNNEQTKRLRCTLLKEGDVLIARMPDPLGRACLFPKLPNDAVTVVDVCLIRLTPSSALKNKLFMYWVNSPTIRNLIDMQASGTTRRRITRKKLALFDFPIPPLNEQTRILDKLDSMLAKVDAAQARLDKIPNILKRFRQSVLAAATSGELTKEWRGQHDEKLTYKLLGDTGVSIKTGPFGSALHKSDYINNGISVINPMHINDGIITPRDSMSITLGKFNELQAWHLRVGDIILGRRGEMGRAAEVKNIKNGMLCGTGSMVLRVNDSGLLPSYLCLILRSQNAVNYFTSNSVGSTMVNLNQKIIKGLSIHFPSFEEQNEIFRRVESLFTMADSLEKQYKVAKARTNRLTQSILAKAFRGELVPQDENYEPASKLLARIKTEQEGTHIKIKKIAKKLTVNKKVANA